MEIPRLKVGSGKFAMGLGSRVLPGAAHPSRVEVCHGKICSTYTLFNKATNGLSVRIVLKVNGYPVLILPLQQKIMIGNPRFPDVFCPEPTVFFLSILTSGGKKVTRGSVFFFTPCHFFFDTH